MTTLLWQCTYIATVRTQLYLDEMTHKRLRRLADRQGRTVTDLWTLNRKHHPMAGIRLYES